MQLIIFQQKSDLKAGLIDILRHLHQYYYIFLFLIEIKQLEILFILQLMRSNKSFANQYGITQKNITSNPSIGLGLNPNLNIEDEYIENLLKQVHFLNMEIKLIKQKQKENKGMGIMGLLNKDQNPVVTHAVTSNNKYSDMKNQLSQLVNTAHVDYIRLDDENFAVKAQRDYAEKNSLKEEQKNIENKIYVDKVLADYREKLGDQIKKLKDLREQHRRTNDIYNRVYQQWEDLKVKTKTKNLLKDITENLDGQSFALKQNHLKNNAVKLEANKKKLQEADHMFRSDPSYTKLVEENTELKDRVKRTDKELFDLSYKVKQMDELKKLAIRNKDVQSQLKKQAIDESERLKKKLADKKSDIDAKLKDAKQNLQTNDQVRLVKGKLARKDKEINDLRKKAEVSENNFKRLRDQILKLQDSLEDKKLKNQQKQKKLNELKAIQNETGVALREVQLNYEKGNSDLGNTENMLRDSKNRLQALQEELAYLIAKQQFLQKSMDIDEQMKNVKIQQLTSLMHNNSGLNETIGTVMTKWQQIIKFTREPPSSS